MKKHLFIYSIYYSELIALLKIFKLSSYAEDVNRFYLPNLYQTENGREIFQNVTFNLHILISSQHLLPKCLNSNIEYRAS